MRRTKHVIATILFCTGLLVSGFQKNDAVVCAAKINTNTTSNFNENKLKTGALEMQEVILDASGKIVSYYIDEDGINQKVVYDEKKDKWTSNTVKDTAKNIKGKKKYYTIYPTAKGYVEAAPDSSEIIFRNFYISFEPYAKPAGRDKKLLMSALSTGSSLQVLIMDYNHILFSILHCFVSSDTFLFQQKLHTLM